jgi:hypothetical protein
MPSLFFLENLGSKENKSKRAIGEVIKYLRENRQEISEFCLQIKDAYKETDRGTPFLMIAGLINEIFENNG